MYEELVEKLRHRGTLYNGISLFDDAANAIEILEALAQNGQSAIDTNKRLADKIRMLKAKLDQAKDALDFCRTKDAEIIRLGQERNRLKRERDQAVEDLYYITKEIGECDIKLSGDDEDHVNSLNLGRCDVCKHRCHEDKSCEFEWRGVQEENNG